MLFRCLDFKHEIGNSLPFLDVRVTKLNNKLLADVYRKDTFTDLGLNYFSFVPHLFKVSSINTPVYKAYSIYRS